jgi:uncharacterized protein (DUF433 family)
LVYDRVKDTRVSLDSVVHAFLRGESPEGIAQSFPSLGLDRIFGALAQVEFEALREQARRTNPALYRKLTEARQSTYAPTA